MRTGATSVFYKVIFFNTKPNLDSIFSINICYMNEVFCHTKPAMAAKGGINIDQNISMFFSLS